MPSRGPVAGSIFLVPLPVVAIMTSMYSCTRSCFFFAAQGPAGLGWLGGPGHVTQRHPPHTHGAWWLFPWGRLQRTPTIPPPTPLCITHTSTRAPTDLDGLQYLLGVAVWRSLPCLCLFSSDILVVCTPPRVARCMCCACDPMYSLSPLAHLCMTLPHP